MARISREHITQFIAQLYRERKGQEAPETLLNGWRNLPEDEIDKNLSGLFTSWGMSEQEKQTAITRFLQKVQVRPAIQTNPAYIPARQESIPGGKPPFTVKKKSRSMIWLVALLIIIVGGFFAYKYLQYSSLPYVYAITDNIAVRNAEGKMTARMDLFPKKNEGVSSYSKLKAMDNTVHYMKQEGSDKEFPTRKVMTDSANFWNYLFSPASIARYVNTNYVVNDKEEFDLYQSAFKEIQEVNADNKKLLAVYRKIIVGSMARTKGMQGRYILTNTKGLGANTTANTESVLIQEIKPNQHYVIIASLDNGIFYRFEGDIKANEYQPLTEVQKVIDGTQSTLEGSFRFIKNDGTWKLFSVPEKNTTHFEVKKDAAGKYILFENNPPEVIPEGMSPGQLLDTVIDLLQ